MDKILIIAGNEKKKKISTFGMQMRASIDLQPMLKSPLAVDKKAIEVQLNLMFYSPPANDHFINRVVAVVSRQEIITSQGQLQHTNYAHVEISFPRSLDMEIFEDSKTMAFSVTQQENVFFRLKSWRTAYDCVPLNVSIEKYKFLYKICTNLSLQNIGFDKTAMYLASFAHDSFLNQRTRQEYGTFCSKIIVEVLQEACIQIGTCNIMDVVPYRSSPSSIFALTYLQR
jgi:hypothetical protein